MDAPIALAIRRRKHARPRLAQSPRPHRSDWHGAPAAHRGVQQLSDHRLGEAGARRTSAGCEIRVGTSCSSPRPGRRATCFRRSSSPSSFTCCRSTNYRLLEPELAECLPARGRHQHSSGRVQPDPRAAARRRQRAGRPAAARRGGRVFDRVRPFGFIILYALMFTGVLSQLILPPADFLMELLGL